MMKQPELGKKIAELRKERGLTQEELVETCNLSVRTLQRIEAGEVTPRSYTLKIIFQALDFPFDQASGKKSSPSSGEVWDPFSGQLIRFSMDLFNLKTHTMKKVSILTAIAAAITLVLFLTLTPSGNAQETAEVEKIIHKNNADFFRWFNSGNIDSLMTLYRDDACLVAVTCGKDLIAEHYRTQSAIYTFERLNNMSISVSDSIAVEKGQWIIILSDGKRYLGEYLTEWRNTNGIWLIVNDIGTVKSLL